VDPIYLFDLVAQQRSALSTRQSLVAQNIANANTPGYKTLDIAPTGAPFATALDSVAQRMTVTDPKHMSVGAIAAARPTPTKPGEGWETTHSGNSVSIEHEMMKAGDIRGAFTLDTNIMKSFHGMWLMSLKG
jgi:flagellar basal-body rod protein FlgB